MDFWRELTLLVLKKRLFNFENWAEVILSNPVLESKTPPVADLYAVKALVAIRMRVVPIRYI